MRTWRQESSSSTSRRGGASFPSRQLGFYVFLRHESQNTNHCLSDRSVHRGAQESQHRKQPPGPLPLPPTDCFPIHGCSVFLGILYTRSKCSSVKIPQKCTKSRFPQENARGAAFAAALVVPRAGPAAVDANGHTVPASTAKTPLIRVDSCPFVVNEPMLKKGNVLDCADTKAGSVAGLLPSEYNGRTAAMRGMCI